jgi:hypothetical protein
MEKTTVRTRFAPSPTGYMHAVCVSIRKITWRQVYIEN